MYFVSCPEQGREMEAAVLHRVGFLENFCPKQGQDFKPSAAPLYPNMGQVPPPPRGSDAYISFFLFQAGLTSCLQERINSEGYTGSTLPGRYSPDCDRDGNYKPSQCQVSSGVCWCVDSQGQEIPGTRGRGERPCPAPGKMNMTCLL